MYSGFVTTTSYFLYIIYPIQAIQVVFKYAECSVSLCITSCFIYLQQHIKSIDQNMATTYDVLVYQEHVFDTKICVVKRPCKQSVRSVSIAFSAFSTPDIWCSRKGHSCCLCRLYKIFFRSK